MSKFTISQSNQPTQAEYERMDREARYFEYCPPNQNAPSSSAAARGWGLMREHAPPPDAVEYVMAMFKRDIAGDSVEALLHPNYKWSIVSVCMAHFAWLRTPAGATWLLRLFGVEEVPMFGEAYAYTYLDRANPINGEPQRVPLDQQSGVQLRIFRACEAKLDPPITVDHDEKISIMKDILRKARNPNATEPIPEPAGDMYVWVSEQLREWFLEPQANLRWPTPKATRITGRQWAKTVTRADGSLVYPALANVEQFQGRAYRLQDREGSVRWCGGEDIRFMLKPDYHRANQTMSEFQIQTTYCCSSCGKVRPCTPVTRDQKMCCHCFGAISERDRRPTLDWCTMKECRNCPDHLESQADLLNLKNRLNREAQFPVKR